MWLPTATQQLQYMPTTDVSRRGQRHNSLIKRSDRLDEALKCSLSPLNFDGHDEFRSSGKHQYSLKDII